MSLAKTAIPAEYFPSKPDPKSNYRYNAEDFDDGPFWLYSAGLPFHRWDMRDGLWQIPVCKVTRCGNGYRWENEQLIGAGPGRSSFDQVGGEFKETLYTMPAGGIRNNVLNVEGYGRQGLVELPSIAHQEIDINGFNQRLYPMVCEYFIDREEVVIPVVHPQLQVDVGKRGALAVRKDMVLEAQKFYQGQQVTGIKYLAAISEILASYSKAEQFISRDLDATEADMRLKRSGGQGKSTYTSYDRMMLLILGRPPMYSAEEKGGGGMSVDVIRSLVQEIAGTQAAPQVDIAAIIKATVAAVSKELMGGKPGRPRTRLTLEEKQAQARARNGKDEPGEDPLSDEDDDEEVADDGQELEG